MTKSGTLFHQIDLWLTSNIHPAMTWGLLTLAIFGLVWATRKWVPGIWIQFDKITPDGTMAHVFQGLPSVGLGAIASVVMLGGDFAEAWKGAVAGALAPLTHLFMKKYSGDVKGYGESAGGGPPQQVSPKAKAAAHEADTEKRPFERRRFKGWALITSWAVVVMFFATLGCASFGKFTEGGKDAAVDAACILLSGIDPQWGPACVTASELLPLAPRVNAARKNRQTKVAGTVAPDPCTLEPVFAP
jgi:hypothetical protein